MIENATLLRMDRSAGSSPVGNPIITTGPAISVRCFRDAVTSKMRFDLGAAVKDAEGVVFVAKDAVADAGEAAPSEDDRLLVAIDDEDPAGVLGEAIFVDDFTHSSLSHYRVFLKKV